MSSTLNPLRLRNLDFCLKNRESLGNIRDAFEKIEKICGAIDRGMHLAELLRDPKTIQSLHHTFGEEDFNVVLQSLGRLSLESFTTRSFTTRRAIEGAKRLEFIYRSLGGWKQFQVCLTIQLASPTQHPVVLFVNPMKADHLQEIQVIPAGSLISVSLKITQGKRSQSQEHLAAERIEAIFDVIQDRGDSFETQIGPQIQVQNVSSIHKSKGSTAKPAAKSTTAKPRLAQKVATNTGSFWKQRATAGSSSGGVPTGAPVQVLKVTINKMDTFLHAGNAHLILNHLKDYAGKVAFAVLRGEKKMVQLDADSMWGAEIRNGETVIFEFYGIRPEDEFLKELAKKVNKYTQMDKVANE